MIRQISYSNIRTYPQTNRSPVNAASSKINCTPAGNNVSFKAKKLLELNLINNVNDKLIPASFYELNAEEDWKTLESTTEDWMYKDSDCYAADISRLFLNPHNKNRNFFAVAIGQDEQPKKENIVSLIQICGGKNDFREIETLQSNPQIYISPYRNRTDEWFIKGAGILALYGVLKTLPESARNIYLCSTNNAYYTHLGFDNSSDSYYELTGQKCNEFLKKIEAKYKLKTN